MGHDRDQRLKAVSEDQRGHWSAILREHSGSPRAVGSESMAHKHLRYAKLAEIFADEREFTVHDIGAGIGHFCDFLVAEGYIAGGATYSASEQQSKTDRVHARSSLRR